MVNLAMVRSPALRTLLVAAATSSLGDGVTVAAAPLLAASLTSDPRMIGAVGVALTLPWLLFALPSGAAAAAAPFALDAVSFAVSGALLSTLPGRLRPERTGAPSTIRADIAEGARWLLRHRVLRTICWVLTLENVVEVAGFVMLVLLAREELGLDARGYGLLLAGFAVGGLAGAAAAERLHRRAGDAGSLVGSTAGMAAAWALLAATGHPVLAGLALAVYGFAAVWWNVVTASFRQAVVPERLQGRVNSAYRLASWGRPRWGRRPAAWSQPPSACTPSTPAPRRSSPCWR
jgi:predicted MFS family arabinose efflux permease